MLRQLPIINEKRQRRRIGIHPSQVVMVEEITKNKCYVVVRTVQKELTYTVPKSFEYIQNFVNLTQFNLFMEN